MESTSLSLLRRLQSDDREIAWDRFVELYAPLIYHWCLQAGLGSHDAADCVQDVLTLLVGKLPTFIYDPKKSFRGWLRRITHNKCLDAHRARATVARKTSPLNPESALAPDDVAVFTDQEYDAFLVQRALDLMQGEFEPNTWRACWKQVVDGESPAGIARQLNMSENAVYLAKSRVLRRLRVELEGLLR